MSWARTRTDRGQLHLTIGWGDEPAFSGFKNFVDVDVADADGKPVTDAAGPLAVEISFGEERTTLPLLPSRNLPGKFRAWIVPTRAGAYTFHITGTVKGQAIDVTSSCSDKTFACVTDASDVQFPAKDPSLGQLADSVKRVLPRADRAAEMAANARIVAFLAIGVGVGGCLATLGIGLRKGRKRV